jgi:hypothetical protein
MSKLEQRVARRVSELDDMQAEKRNWQDGPNGTIWRRVEAKEGVKGEVGKQKSEIELRQEAAEGGKL